MKKTLLVLCTVLALAACNEDQSHDPAAMQGASRGGGVMSAKMNSYEMAESKGMADAAMLASPPSAMVLDRDTIGNRKIAETHNLQIETEYNQLQPRFQRDYALCVSMGCQIMNSYVAAEQGGNIAARIAPEKLGAFLDKLAEGEGEIKNHSVSADDYTMEYADTEAQNQNLLALRERLRTLLNAPQVEKINDILRIEQELTRVQTQIDQRTARLRILKTMTDMATVNLNYNVKYRPAEIRPYELKNTWRATANKFMRGVDNVIQFTGATLPWVPVFFAGLWILVRLVRFAFAKVSITMPWRRKSG